MRYHANIIAPIPGSDGHFATRSGEILSIRRGRLRRISQTMNYKGYLHAWSRLGKRGVHRLVLMAFDRDPVVGEVAMHINNNRSDNRSSNLRWGTPKENSEQMVAEGRGRKSRRPWIISEAMSSTMGNSDLARKHGVDPCYICHIRKGRRGPGSHH